MLKIETERLILREPTMGDFAFLKSLWEDGRVMHYVGFPNGLKQSDEKIVKWINTAQMNRNCKLVIEDKESGKTIGETGYRLDLDYPHAHDRKSAAPDIKLIPEFWGKGLATEAFEVVIDYIFKNTDVEVIQVSPNIKNLAALKIYEKLGFKKVGDPITESSNTKQKTTPQVQNDITNQYMEMVRE